MNAINKLKRGRPSVTIQWPDKATFTVKDVLALTSGAVSGVTIRTKINEDIAAGILTKVGKSASTRGRPSETFRKVSSHSVALNPPPATEAAPDQLNF